MGNQPAPEYANKVKIIDNCYDRIMKNSPSANAKAGKLIVSSLNTTLGLIPEVGGALKAMSEMFTSLADFGEDTKKIMENANFNQSQMENVAIIETAQMYMLNKFS